MSIPEASAPAGPSPQGGLDAVVDDHNKIRDIFLRYSTASGPEAKLKLSRELVRTVSRHASAEERTLYPLALKVLNRAGLKGEAQLVYDRMVMDDKINKEMLNYLDSHRPDTEPEWRIYDATWDKFAAIEQEHLAKEEQEVVERLRGLLTPQEATRFGHDWAAALRNAPTRPHPRGPTAGLAAKLVHPVVGAVDRAVDAMTGGRAGS